MGRVLAKAPTALITTLASMVSTPSGVAASNTHTLRASSKVARCSSWLKRVFSYIPYFWEMCSR